LEKLFDKKDYKRLNKIQQNIIEKDRLDLRKSNLLNDFTDMVIISYDYLDMKARVDKDILIIDKLTDLQQEVSPFKIYIQEEVSMLENLQEYNRKSVRTTKKKIPGCIFGEKLVLESGRVAISTFTVHIQFILNASEFLGSSKKNKRSILTSCASGYPERTKVATMKKVLITIVKANGEPNFLKPKHYLRTTKSCLLQLRC